MGIATAEASRPASRTPAEPPKAAAPRRGWRGGHRHRGTPDRSLRELLEELLVGAERALGGCGDAAAVTCRADGLEDEAHAVRRELELGVLVDVEQLEDRLLDD